MSLHVHSILANYSAPKFFDNHTAVEIKQGRFCYNSARPNIALRLPTAQLRQPAVDIRCREKLHVGYHILCLHNHCCRYAQEPLQWQLPRLQQ